MLQKWLRRGPEKTDPQLNFLVFSKKGGKKGVREYKVEKLYGKKIKLFSFFLYSSSTALSKLNKKYFL